MVAGNEQTVSVKTGKVFGYNAFDSVTLKVKQAIQITTPKDVEGKVRVSFEVVAEEILEPQVNIDAFYRT